MVRMHAAGHPRPTRPRDASSRSLTVVLATAALAWAAALVLAQIAGGTRIGPAQGAGMSGAMWWCGLGHSAVVTGGGWGYRQAGLSALRRLPGWVLMSTAMMLPATLPAVRHVANNSLRWRRGRAVVLFLGAYLGLWALFGLTLLAALAVLGHFAGARLATSGLASAGALGLAAAWQLCPQKRRALRSCYRTVPLPARGVRAAVADLRFGLRHGSGCLGACWCLMLAMALFGHGQFVWMLAITSLIVSERLLPSRRRSRRVSALALVLAAVAVGVL